MNGNHGITDAGYKLCVSLFWKRQDKISVHWCSFVVNRSLMKMHVTSKARSIATATALLCATVPPVAPAATPQYQIYDIGVVQVGDTASQGFGVSHGGIAVGRSFRTGGSEAFTWTLNGGLVGLPNLSGRNYAVSNSANDTGS